MPTRLYCAETQYLLIAGIKGAGMDAMGAIQFTEPDIGAGEMTELGLRPLAVLAIVVPAYKIYSRQIVDPQAFVSVSSFLEKAWSEKEGLGLPLTLEMREHFEGFDRGLFKWLALNGVTPVLVPKADKAHVAFAKAASAIGQFHCTWEDRSLRARKSMSLTCANAGIRSYDLFVRKYPSETSMVVLNVEAYLSRQKRFSTVPHLTSDCDLRGLTLHRVARPEPEMLPVEGETFHYAPRGLKELIEQWPGGKKRLFQQTQLQTDELRWWLDDRAHVHPVKRRELFRILRIEPDDYSDEEEIDRRYKLSGGYLILAKSRRAFVSLYDELSNGGDLRLSVELLPPTGAVPPQRILVFANCGDFPNVVVFPREDWVDGVLNSSCLINFTGAVRAPQQVWDYVDSIVQVGQQVEDPSILGAILERKHEQWFQHLEASHRYG